MELHEIRSFGCDMLFGRQLLTRTLLPNKFRNEGILGFMFAIYYASFAVIAYNVLIAVRIIIPTDRKRLMKLRIHGVSPDGNIMRKLRESEEEHHLEPWMKAEGRIHSIDYDIWLDDTTGYRMVEKYPAFQHVEECSECGFFTMKLEAEEIEQAPTSEQQGLLMKHYNARTVDTVSNKK